MTPLNAASWPVQILADGAILAVALTVICLLWCACTSYWLYEAVRGLKFGATAVGVVLLVQALYETSFVDLPGYSFVSAVVRKIPLYGGTLVDVALLASEVALFLLAWRLLRPLSWLEAHLWRPNTKEVRARAIRHMSRLAREGNGRAVKAVLEYAEPWGRLTEATEPKETLVWLASGEVHDLLFKKLRHSRRDAEADAAFDVLSRIGKGESIEVLLKLIAKTNGSNRLMAVKTLGAIGNANVIAPLLDLATDRDPKLVETTWETLGRLGASTTQQAEYCVRAIGHSHSSVIVFAAKQLCLLGEAGSDAMVKLLGEKNSVVRRNLMEGLLGAVRGAPALGDHIVAVLAVGLTDDSPAVRHPALGALMRTANRSAVLSIPGLAGLLRDESGDVRCLAMTLFADAGEPMPDVLPAILENVGFASSNVRKEAATTLGKIGALAQPEVVGVLISALDREADFEVGGEIVKTLTRIDVAAAAIEKYAHRKEAHEREQAEHDSGGGGGSSEWGYNGYVSAGSLDLAGSPPSGANDYSSHGM